MDLSTLSRLYGELKAQELVLKSEADAAAQLLGMTNGMVGGQPLYVIAGIHFPVPEELLRRVTLMREGSQNAAIVSQNLEQFARNAAKVTTDSAASIERDFVKWKADKEAELAIQRSNP